MGTKYTLQLEYSVKQPRCISRSNVTGSYVEVKGQVIGNFNTGEVCKINAYNERKYGLILASQ
jgi:hypothetical protein